jgi:hypothetical protein
LYPLIAAVTVITGTGRGRTYAGIVVSQTCVLSLKNASIAYTQTLVMLVLGTPRVDLFIDSENVIVCAVCVLFTGKEP